MIGTYQTSLIFIKIGYMNLHILSLFGFINIFLFAGPEHGSWGRNREETWNFIINFYLVYVYIYNLCNFSQPNPSKENHPRILSLKLTLIHFQDIPIIFPWHSNLVDIRDNPRDFPKVQPISWRKSPGTHLDRLPPRSRKRSEKLKTVASADRAETIQIVGCFLTSELS